MKKTFVKGLALAVLGTALVAGSAWATPTLTLSDGIAADTQVFTDGGAGDLSSLPGVITVYTTIGNWTVNTSTGQSPVYGSTVLPHLDLNDVHNSSTGGGTLTITLSDTPAWSPGTTGLNLLAGGTSGGTVSFQAMLDGTTMGTLGPYGVGAFSGDTSIVGTGTTVDLIATVTHTGAAVTSFDAELKPVPEPATMLLLGSGLLGLAGVGRRKMKKA